jgi:SAM-dependent methyltransferase
MGLHPEEKVPSEVTVLEVRRGRVGSVVAEDRWCRGKAMYIQGAIPMSTYDSIGVGYAKHRRPDARIGRVLRDALGDARSVVNVGAGAGSYEPDDVAVTAVEPSWQMLGQRERSAGPAVRAMAERLPFADKSFDAGLAVLTVHHWQDARTGVREMARVARGRLVILTWDPGHAGFWLTRDYFPELMEQDRGHFPTIRDLEAWLGGAEVTPVPVPADCTDGFLGAYWKRPAAYLNPEIRRSISTFSRMGDLTTGLARLQSDLREGVWFERNQALLDREEMDLGYMLLVANLV